MKKSNYLLLLMLFTALALTTGCKEETIPQLPTVVTFPVSDIEQQTATCGGSVTSESSISSRGVCWSTHQNPTTADSVTLDGAETGSFSSYLSNLRPDSTYYIRAYATNSAGTGYGSEMKFKTKKANISVLTLTVSDVSQYSATCGGIVTSDPGVDVLSYGVCWSNISQNPTINDYKTTESVGTVSFTSQLTNLILFTTYYVRAYATSASGTVYGNTMSFKTAPGLASIKTVAINNIASNSAKCDIEIISDGGSTVTAIGACWGSYPNPTLNYSSVTTTSINQKSLDLAGLNEYTTYYVRAFITNSYGTSFGENVKFSTSGTSANNGIIFNSSLTYGNVSDVDGNVYKTITVGTQTWMAENLRVTHFRNGDAIPQIELFQAITDSVAIYQCEHLNPLVYGRYYSWNAATDTRNICPQGYHLPSEEEWNTLITYLGGSAVAGAKLRETGSTHWASVNTSATNLSGMTALPAGYIQVTDKADYIGGTSNWWFSTTKKSDSGMHSYLIPNNSNAQKMNINRNYGLSIRCIKD